jgi:hypothetical protein
MVGDGHAVGVSADIGDELLGSAKGFFAVDDPLLSFAFPEETLKAFRKTELREGVGKVDLSFPKASAIAWQKRSHTDLERSLTGTRKLVFEKIQRLCESSRPPRCNDVEMRVK